MQLDAKALAATTADIVRRHVQEATAPLLRRIEELESRQPDPGERGEPGEQGAPGDAGAGVSDLLIDREGALVATFTDGRMKVLGGVVGRDGETGPQGEKGATGERGTDGANGSNGVDGKDGAPGEQGPRGEPGEQGIAGIAGIDGKDGEAGPQGEAGTPGEAGADGIDGKDAYPGEAKGLYDPQGEYRALDCVSFNGSEWRAKQDNPGPLPGEGWMLSAGRGKRGDRGERGDRGMDGKAGRDAPLPVGLSFDAEKMQFAMVLDNGEILEADFAPVARAMIDGLREA